VRAGCVIYVFSGPVHFIAMMSHERDGEESEIG